jgi:hypothetical protein
VRSNRGGVSHALIGGFAMVRATPLLASLRRPSPHRSDASHLTNLLATDPRPLTPFGRASSARREFHQPEITAPLWSNLFWTRTLCRPSAAVLRPSVPWHKLPCFDGSVPPNAHWDLTTTLFMAMSNFHDSRSRVFSSPQALSFTARGSELVLLGASLVLQTLEQISP